jgi:hypothetical protein
VPNVSATTLPPSPSPSIATPTRPASYWQLSRAPRYSVLFALPLLLLYEALAAALSGPGGGGVRNGADVLLKALFIAVAGARGPMIFAAVLVIACVWIVARDMRKHRGGLRPGVFVAMGAESAVLASVFGIVIGMATARVLGVFAANDAPITSLVLAQVDQLGGPTKLMVSLGAGLYEELLFRVVLVSALMVGARSLLGFGRVAAGVLATVGGALIFSAFHYVGPMGDPFQVDSFVFRTLSGLAFSGLYVMRGFGITAWTHALYDVFLLVV